MSNVGISGIPSWGAPTLEDFDTSNIREGERIGGNSARQYVRFRTDKITKMIATKVSKNDKTGEVKVLERESQDFFVEMVHVKTPGDKNEYDGEATEFHKRTFMRQYMAFRAGRTAPLGKDLDDCTYLSSNIAFELKVLGCHTEEQLAAASDLLCDRIPNGWEYREFARANQAAMAANNSNSQVASLTAQVNQLLNIVKSAGLLTPEGLPITPREVSEQVPEGTGAKIENVVKNKGPVRPGSKKAN